MDAAPLAPACGLLLDEIAWFDLKEGRYEARVPRAARAAMEEFKAARVYPHIHARYQQDAHAQSFVPRLRDGSLTQARARPARWVAGRQERCARRGRASREW